MPAFGTTPEQIEISSAVDALDGTGRPVNFGWARQPLWRYSSVLIRAPSSRIYASDRYLVQCPGWIISMQVSDGGAQGYVGLTILSLKNRKRTSQLFSVPFPFGGMNLPDSALSGEVRFRKKRNLVQFTPMESGVRIIRLDIPKFGRHHYLRGELVLTPLPGAESLVTCMPCLKNRSAFALVQRSPGYSAEGIIQFGAQEILFPQGKSQGFFEWSRGVRPRRDTHFLAAASGVRDGMAAGLSAGFGGVDNSAGTENAFFLNGRIHKLDQVTFHISPSNWMEPWRFTSSDKRLEMTFTPEQERIERRSWFFHTRALRQYFGVFAGRVILDDGSPFEFGELPGMCERRKTVN